MGGVGIASYAQDPFPSELAASRRLKKIMKLIKKASIPDFAFHLGFAAKVGAVTTFSDQCDLRIS